MKITAVGLQVHNASRLQEIAVTVHEKRRSKPLLFPSDLRIRKRNPYLRHFIGSKKRLNELNARTKERHILKTMIFSIFGPLPQTCALDVHANIITRRIPLGKINRIITFAAAKFEDNRIVIAKESVSPIAFHRMIAAQHLRSSRLDHTPESLVFPEFSKLVLSHRLLLFLRLFLWSVIPASVTATLAVTAFATIIA